MGDGSFIYTIADRLFHRDKRFLIKKSGVLSASSVIRIELFQIFIQVFVLNVSE